MARKPKAPKKKTLATNITPEQYARAKALAGGLGLTPYAWMRRLVEDALGGKAGGPAGPQHPVLFVGVYLTPKECAAVTAQFCSQCDSMIVLHTNAWTQAEGAAEVLADTRRRLEELAQTKRIYVEAATGGYSPDSGQMPEEGIWEMDRWEKMCQRLGLTWCPRAEPTIPASWRSLRIGGWGPRKKALAGAGVLLLTSEPPEPNDMPEPARDHRAPDTNAVARALGRQVATQAEDIEILQQRLRDAEDEARRQQLAAEQAAERADDGGPVLEVDVQTIVRPWEKKVAVFEAALTDEKATNAKKTAKLREEFGQNLLAQRAETRSWERKYEDVREDFDRHLETGRKGDALPTASEQHLYQFAIRQQVLGRDFATIALNALTTLLAATSKPRVAVELPDRPDCTPSVLARARADAR